MADEQQQPSTTITTESASSSLAPSSSDLAQDATPAISEKEVAEGSSAGTSEASVTESKVSSQDKPGDTQASTQSTVDIKEEEDHANKGVEETSTRKRVPKRPKDYSEVIGKDSAPARKSQRQKPAVDDVVKQEVQATVQDLGEGEAPVKKRGGGRKKSTAGTPSKPRQAAHAQPVYEPQDSQYKVEETAYQKLMHDLGKARLADLSSLTRAFIEHSKTPSAPPLRDFLANAMQSSTRWSGDQCLHYLATIKLAGKPAAQMNDASLHAAFQREPSVFDLLERFTQSNWVKEQDQPQAVAQNSIEATAFALWATNLRASNAIPTTGITDEILLINWQSVDPQVRQHFETLAAHMQQMENVARATNLSSRAQ